MFTPRLEMWRSEADLYLHSGIYGGLAGEPRGTGSHIISSSSARCAIKCSAPPPRQPPTLEERTQQLRNINKTFATFAVVQTQRNLLAQPPGGLEQHSEDGLCAHFPYSWLLGLHRGAFEHITRPGRVRGVGWGGAARRSRTGSVLTVSYLECGAAETETARAEFEWFPPRTNVENF